MRHRLVSAFVAVLVGATAMTPVGAAPTGVDPMGRWSAVGDWPLIAIHAALTPSGDVVTYGTDANGVQSGAFIYDVWDSSGDVESGHTTLPNLTDTDTFCSIQVLRPGSNNLMLFGGDNVGPDGQSLNLGNSDVNVYDDQTGVMSTVGQMERRRWYATAITLPDESVYIQGGFDEPGVNFGNDIAERWTEETGSQPLPFSTTNIDYWYPRVFVMTDGRIFGVDVDGKLFFVSADLQTLTMVGQIPYDTGFGAAVVMYEPDKLLVMGGESNKMMKIDVTSGNPVMTPAASMTGRREWVTATLLPDGRVLANNGSAAGNETIGVGYASEIWDPATGAWTVGAEAVKPRLYHSTALLLPDGRVLIAGGGAPGPLTNLNAEIYSPDYLVAADGSDMPRPEITSVPSGTQGLGGTVGVTVDDASDIDRVTLLKTGSVTHSLNVDQRFLEADWTSSGNNITVQIPSNPAEMTPGHYLLTVIDDNGIPSESKIIQVREQEAVPVSINAGVGTVTEGDVGEVNLDVPVTLSAPSSTPVSVDWETLDLTGDGFAETGVDFVEKSGTVTFSPGQTSKSVRVKVIGDTVFEPPLFGGEWLAVSLSNPTANATIDTSWAYGLGIGVIFDDDPVSIHAGVGTVKEGNSGEVVVNVPLTLSNPLPTRVRVDWQTLDLAGAGFATPGVDFIAASGRVTFLPGQTQVMLPVRVLGDTVPEPPLLGGEWIAVQLSNPTANAVIDTSWLYGLGLGIIIDDD